MDDGGKDISISCNGETVIERLWRRFGMCGSPKFRVRGFAMSVGQRKKREGISDAICPEQVQSINLLLCPPLHL